MTSSINYRQSFLANKKAKSKAHPKKVRRKRLLFLFYTCLIKKAIDKTNKNSRPFFGRGKGKKDPRTKKYGGSLLLCFFYIALLSVFAGVFTLSAEVLSACSEAALSVLSAAFGCAEAQAWQFPPQPAKYALPSSVSRKYWVWEIGRAHV